MNHLERFILRADDPSADDYSAFMGARAELVPDLIEACETLGVDPLEAMRVETRAIDLSRLEWDRSFGWYSMPSDESSQAPAIRAT